jgi:diguanylate cyclase (GGDEF)-like protein/PAS domain S-box-containing protein
MFRGRSRSAALLHLAVLALVVGLIDWGGIMLTREAGRAASVWLANGVVLAVLLCSPKQRWSVQLGVSCAANLAADLLSGDSLAQAVPLVLCDLAEILSAAWPLQARLGLSPDLTRRGPLLTFLLFAVVLAPACSALLAAEWLSCSGGSFTTVLHRWFAADALGMGIVTPAALIMLRGGWRARFSRAQWRRTALPLLGFAAIAAGIFAQTHYPLLFLIMPALFAVTVRLGFGGTAMAVPILTAIALGFTLEGRGPLALQPNLALPEKILVAQFFIFVAASFSFSLAVLMEERQRIAAALEAERLRLRESEALYRLLSDHSCDVIARVNADGRFFYVSPSVREVLGWEPEALIGRPWSAFVDRDDRKRIGDAQRNDPSGIVANTFRCRRKDGSYAWVEARTRLIRDARTGAVREFVSNVRDITRQKQAEDELAALAAELARLADTDSLTGLANRRGLDQLLEKAGRRAVRDARPLAVLMLDVDWFKQFNDRYGHQRGDDVLKRVAAAIEGCLRRPGDVAGRYGGEEFMVVLPDTDAGGARNVAEAIRGAVQGLNIGHADSPDGLMTVSIGVAASVPADERGWCDLVHAADKALYAAKAQGRNRIEAAAAGRADKLVSLT